jgi:hypothetical protein
MFFRYNALSSFASVSSVMFSALRSVPEALPTLKDAQRTGERERQHPALNIQNRRSGRESYARPLLFC